KDRGNPALDQSEVKKFKEGSFSGKPVLARTNELIALAHRHCAGLPIIGCGGIFNAKDAYQKIRLGASLLQLITGMIFEGPQLISEINIGLTTMLKKDGFRYISEAVGADA
ncbi:dihydroorotate dehydrogenase (quinone), partial [Candidatus Peregrinibacteria bacterium]|nr:dihydroorotate dehydrogenase (quinone) [Candidatus Peregrinibacteria bacterium]